MSLEFSSQESPTSPMDVAAQLVASGWIDSVVQSAADKYNYPYDRRADISQIVALRMVENPDYITDDGFLGAKVIARNAMLDDLDHSRTRRESWSGNRLLNAPETIPMVPDMPEQQIEILPPYTHVEEQATNRVLVEDILSKLLPEHREVVRLCKLGDMSMQAAAEVLGVPDGTVKSRLHNALRYIRNDLSAHGIDEYSDL